MQRGYFILLCLLAVACKQRYGDAPSQVAADKPALTVMTYNIASYAKPDLSVIAREIKAAAPDFVALQEVDRFTKRNAFDMAKKLAEATGMHASFKKAMNTDSGEFGVGILSRHALIQDGMIALPSPKNISQCKHKNQEQRVAAWVEVRHPSLGKMFFVSTHFGLCSYERAAAVQELQKELSGRTPLVIAGDFNDDLLRDGKQTGVAELFAKAGFTEAEAKVQDEKRMDWILADACWQPQSLKVLPMSVSDHAAVVASLQLTCSAR